MILVEVGIVILIATFFSFLINKFKQPFILAYILAGVIIGPVFGLIKDTDTIMAFSEIGIAFLLFIAGLEMDMKKLRDLGSVVTFTGIIDILTMFSLGFLVSILLGFFTVEALYIGLAIAFSSTMIALKLLSDKELLDTLHGRIVLGILLLEDFFAVVAISVLSTEEITALYIFISLIKIIFLLVVSILIAKYVIPHLFKHSSRSQEHLFITALAVLFGFSILFHYVGFSVIIGAFIAGISITTTQYNLNIIGKMKPLRDFFSTLFFVSLGMLLSLYHFGSIALLVVILTLIIVVLKPWMLSALIRTFGYKTRTAFLSGTSLAQISEFSFIIITQGFILGHVSKEIFTIVILVAISSMIISSYYIKFGEVLYSKFPNFLKALNNMPHHKEQLEHLPKKLTTHIVIFGGHRIGSVLIETFKKLKQNIVVVDYDPDIIKILIKENIPCIYGDVSNDDILKKLRLSKANIVISTVPNQKDNQFILKHVKEINPDLRVFVTAAHINDALELERMGADYVFLPHILTGQRISDVIQSLVKKKTTFIKLKKKSGQQLLHYLNHLTSFKHKEKLHVEDKKHIHH